LINVTTIAFRENLLIGVKGLGRIHTAVVLGSKGRRWVERVACLQGGGTSC
jgi:hypothetical protein